jgi:hypothetical protein
MIYSFFFNIAQTEETNSVHQTTNMHLTYVSEIFCHTHTCCMQYIDMLIGTDCRSYLPSKISSELLASKFGDAEHTETVSTTLLQLFTTHGSFTQRLML